MSSSVLVHVCCAHCAAFTLNFWKRQGYNVNAFWYNPNIYPQPEHDLRLAPLKLLLTQYCVPVIYSPGYEPGDFEAAVLNREHERCRWCFRLRLAATARMATQNRMMAFTTSLLISPTQQHDEIIATGDEIACDTGLKFLYADLRRRYSASRVMTRPENLYQQVYCGCRFSFREQSREA